MAAGEARPRRPRARRVESSPPRRPPTRPAARMATEPAWHSPAPQCTGPAGKAPRHSQMGWHTRQWCSPRARSSLQSPATARTARRTWGTPQREGR
eukprot:scaffold37491_cov30-Tisochrysis_lutea.AAC.1